MTKPLEGGVYVDKRVLNHAIWRNLEYAGAWVTLLLLTNDKDRNVPIKGHLLAIKRGQCAWSLVRLQTKLGKGRRWLNSFLEVCTQEGLVTIQKSPQGVLINITNYDAYNSLIQAMIEQQNVQYHAPFNGENVHAKKDQDENQNVHSPVQGNVQQKGEGEKGEATIASALSEVPEEMEVEAYCNQFTDLKRGITKIPEIWWRGWLGAALGRANFPRRWKESLKQAFLADLLAGHPKALGKTWETPQNKDETEWWPKRERGELYQLILTAKERGNTQEVEDLRQELHTLYGKAAT